MFEAFGKIEYHQCTSSRIGDWIVYYCPQCQIDVRKQNIKTGQMVSMDMVDLNVFHTGVYDGRSKKSKGLDRTILN